MAICKFVNETYSSLEDLRNLLIYCADVNKNCICKYNAVFDCPAMHYYRIEHLALRWYYYHQFHKKQLTTLCYHYVLSFNLNYEYKELQQFNLSLFMYDLTKAAIFKDTNIFIAAHRRNDSLPQHLHIVVDSMQSLTGKGTFITMDTLKRTIGEMLSEYNIPLAGYSYRNITGKIRLDNRNANDLYDDLAFN